MGLLRAENSQPHYESYPEPSVSRKLLSSGSLNWHSMIYISKLGQFYDIARPAPEIYIHETHSRAKLGPSAPTIGILSSNHWNSISKESPHLAYDEKYETQ